MGLARTALEVADPELARHVDVIGTAAFSMHDALERFTSLPVGADGTLASLALGANVANIGLMLAGEFMDSGDSGPSSDDLIFEQLVQLRQQVQELREELHERFDRVHEQLDAMYATLVDGLDVLLRRDDLRYASVMSSLENGRRQLTEIARVQLDTQAIVIDQFTFLEDLVTDLALSECEAPPHVINDDGGEQHQQWFQRCRFAMMSIHRSLPGRQLRPESRTTISERLETHPDRMIAFQYESFRRFLAATGPEGVARATAMSSRTPTVGPDVWYSLIDLHDGFLVAYPELAARDPQFLEDGIVPNQFSRAMQRWRGHLLGFADTIREELRAFQDEARPTVFSQLLEDVWDRGRFDSLLRSLGDPIELLWNCMGSGAGASEDCAVLQDLGSSHHVRRLLLGDPGATSYATCGSARQDFQDLQRRMAIGDLHLRNWLALAFRSDVGRSETVTALAAGWVGLPDLCRMMKEYDLDFASWPAVLDVIEFHVGELQRVLRSASMREAARSELVHPILTDVRYPSLGDVPLAHVLP